MASSQPRLLTPLLRRAQKLWATFYPERPGLDDVSLAVLPTAMLCPRSMGLTPCAQLLASEIVKETDHDGNAVISFDEFEPWCAAGCRRAVRAVSAREARAGSEGATGSPQRARDAGVDGAGVDGASG